MNIVRYPRYAQWLWLAPAALGLALTALTMLVLPPDRVIHGPGDFLLKISPLALAVLTIAAFPRRNPWALVLVVLGFIFYLGYVDSASFLHVSRLVDAALASKVHARFPDYYRFSIFVNAFVVLFALFAFRMGGGSAAQVLKLGFSGLLVLVSGLNDLTMWLMYPWPGGQRPRTFDWASHVSIFVGHTPRLVDMLAFLAIHLLLIAVILRLPLQRWLDHLAQRRWGRPLAPRPVQRSA